MDRSDRKTRGCLPLRWSSMSKAVDSFIGLIVGKGLADERDMARYERSVASADARNKAATQVVYESPPPAHPRRDEIRPLLERSRSVAGTIPMQGSIRPPCPRRRTSPAPRVSYITQTGPPDISAADISEEQLSRTYSRSCVWDPKINPVPPMQEMQGFGRFRRSIYADADWELKKFRGDLQTLGPAAMQHLGDFEIAKLKSGVMNNIRAPIYASLACSDPEDLSVGPRIRRGFRRSKTSLAVNLDKERSCSTSRARSGTVSPGPTEDSGKSWRPLTKRAPVVQFENGPAPLSTIDERAITLPKKKKTVPLIFDEQGMVDEVVEDDDGYETCEESFVTKEFPGKGNKQDTTTVTSNWHEKKALLPQAKLPSRNHSTRNYRTMDVAQEKARVGQKKSGKPPARRPSSRGIKALASRAVSKKNIPRAVEEKVTVDSNLKFADFISKHLPASSDGSVEENGADISLYIAEPKVSIPVSKENLDTSHSPAAKKHATESGVQQSSVLQTAQGRNRSNTAIRVVSGNAPIIYVEDDVKPLQVFGDVSQRIWQQMTV